MVQGFATQWLQSYPCETKTSQETQRSLQKFLEPNRKPKVIYTDSSLESGKACEGLSWNHYASTPHRSETSEIAERAVRRVKEGTSAVLLQSGLNESWWADSMERYTYLRNVTDLLSDGKTPHERRFGQPFKGPIIPFGSLVEYHPITAKDQSRIVKEGTSAVLLQSVLEKEWWADSMECHCSLRKNQDLLSDGKTPYERRFGKPFNGPVIPFGALVEYHPISASRLHQFGPKVFLGIFLGYVLYAG